MIKNVFLLLVFFFFCSETKAQNMNGETLLTQMHAKYAKGPCKMYTFSQKNSHYRNDSLIKNSEWHEAIEFPDKFRINFGDKANGNYVLFRNDSAINYRKGKFLKARSDSNTLLLLLGGMYYRELKDVILRLKAGGFKTEISSEQSFQDKTVWVIGADRGDLNSNQIWIDKKTLNVLRIIESMGGAETIDMHFEAHQPWCKGFVETKVSFSRNGKLEQVEEYYNIKVVDKFPE